jgi:hypothetical protein
VPVEWHQCADSLNLAGSGKYRIAAEDGERQTVTARALLEQLRDQPGIVLADEVGMGKTYVALGVVAATLLATRRTGDPVIVMVPPGLVNKWQREWQQFKATCTSAGALNWMHDRDRFARSPTEFFKLLDQPRERRPRLIWLTTTCFSQGLGDGWIKLALVRLARRHTRMDDEGKRRLFKWASTLTRLRSKRGLSEEVVEKLMVSEPRDWKGVLVDNGILDAADTDPVPEHLVRHADDRRLDWKPLIDVLHGVPGRRVSVSNEALAETRFALNEECQNLYWTWLSCAEWKASLLVLDEAHHAKNDRTRLASLFRSSDLTTLIEGRDDARPFFSQKAERMLFLTATPFQLGHHELIRVLRSFAAVRWTGAGAPVKPREGFLTALDTLEVKLNQNRLAGRRLDTLWGRLSPTHIGTESALDRVDTVANWWAREATGTEDALVNELRRAVEECRRTKLAAERDATEPWRGLQNWVVRHNRPTMLPHASNGVTVLRRVQRFGDAIRSSGEDDSATASGVPISGTSALPFLLAARAQAELAASDGHARAYFAEGLSSSFEAFHHTRDERGDVREHEEQNEEAPTDGSTTDLQEAGATVVPLEWYERHVAEFVPNRDKPLACFSHPKLRSVVERAVSLWLDGEKVLIFCFYRETVKALRNHLTREVDRAINQRVADRLGLAGDKEKDARKFLGIVAKRLTDRNSPFRNELMSLVAAELDVPRFQTLAPWRERIVAALVAYVRSPAFIARYVAFDLPEVLDALRHGETRADVIHHGTDALRRSFAEATDASGLTMVARVRDFLAFALELAERSQAPAISDDEEEDAPSALDEYLKAMTVYIEHSAADGDDASAAKPGTARSSPARPVRMVFGGTSRIVRERLMLAFNSPLFPEILVSSSVLGEGVDLHRFCRHVIHHDLDWNPSTLEQRTGRLDRIRCKAELTRRSIVVFEPFLAGSADEKMFRVVRDRERWFQVVMGQKFELDERTTEALAARVPLPPSIAGELLFDLRRWQG